ncbi:MAG: Sec-independent protein translocase subunit TatA [Jatrophihabitantaceae bacterium]
MGGWDAPWHWVVLAIIVIALLGYKKLPDASRSLGRSLRIFKTEIKGMGEDDKKRAEARESGPSTPPAVEGAAPVAPPVAPPAAPPTVPAASETSAPNGSNQS